MSNKEIVNKGLQARKDVRAAEARAERFRQDADDQRDARFYERNKYMVERQEWRDEREELLRALQASCNKILDLVEDRNALAEREKATRQRYFVFGAVKALLAAAAFAIFRDLGWTEPWLANVLAGASVLCAGYAVVKLAKNK